MFNLSACFCYFGVLSLLLLLEMVCVCAWSFSLATMEYACLARIKCWTNRNDEFINIEIYSFFPLFPFSHSLIRSFTRSFIHLFGAFIFFVCLFLFCLCRRYFFRCCKWLILSECCALGMIWWQSVGRFFFYLMCHSLCWCFCYCTYVTYVRMC